MLSEVIKNQIDLFHVQGRILSTVLFEQKWNVSCMYDCIV